MDSLTQIVVGIATVEVLAGKKLGNKRTFIYGAILGTLPDLDIWIGYLFDPVRAVDFHRSLTHSFLGILLLSPLLGALFWRIEKKRISYLLATILVGATITTHIAIDLFTSWGVQLFYPNSMRVSFKTIFVIDPLYTLPWIIALAVMWKQRGKQRLLALKKGFLWSSAYLLWTVAAKLYAVQEFKKALDHQNIAYQELIVKPTALNSILWQSQVKGEHQYYIGDYSFFDTQPIQFESYQNNPSAEKAIHHTDDFATLVQVTEGWYIIEQHDDTYHFNDLRFGVMNNQSDQQQFVFSYIFLPQENGYKVIEAPKTARDGKELMKKLWIRMKGN